MDVIDEIEEIIDNLDADIDLAIASSDFAEDLKRTYRIGSYAAESLQLEIHSSDTVVGMGLWYKEILINLKNKLIDEKNNER